MPGRPVILMLAGEVSGDLHGSRVARALKKRWPSASLVGLGGERMAAEGVELLAGLDGVRKEIDPTEAGFGPFDADIFSWSSERREGIKPLPNSLKGALDALKEDHDFLLVGGVFPEDLIERWIAYKFEEEYYQVRNRPHPYEMALYYDT